MRTSELKGGVMLRFHRSIIFTDSCFSFTSTLADAMRSMDVSRSPDSLISYPRLPYHVPLARVLVRSRSCLTCFLLLVPVYRYG